MVRSAKGIERLLNLICISYAACKLLPYYDKEFADCRGQSTQEVRYQLGEKIRMVETWKNNYLIKKALNELIHKCG